VKYYLTTAIDYTNASPHIGHAYEKILADVIARYRRFFHGETFFLTGVDQHGQKVQQASGKQGRSPESFAEEVTQQFLAMWRKLGISYDGWAATTDPRHKNVVQGVLQALYDQGEIYKATYAGHYSVRQEQFLTDKERNEQGEFGPEWGEVIFLEEENWYFRLAKHKDWLRDYVEKHPEFVTPAFRRTELINAIERLSGDLSISRPKSRLSWGIEIPFDRDYVTYVWFDALLNYLTFAGYHSEPDWGFPDFNQLWPCQAHIIGKDILVPAHGIYWPIMLHAMGFPDEQIPRLLVHGWWLGTGGSKMSKSLGNAIDPNVLADRFGADALRYYLVRDMAIGHDADFSLERLILRYNNDLANDLGNLVNRTINMSQRYRSGILAKRETTAAELRRAQQFVSAAIQRYREAFDQFQVHIALETTWEIVAQANSLVEQTAPWKLAKDPDQSELLDGVLYTLAETARLLAVLTGPVIPNASAKILDQLNAAGLTAPIWGQLGDGHQLGAPSPIFPRIESIE
jgi:methionyl-tRNA synthetase